MKTNRHYYVSGNTRIGFYSVLPELSKELDCIFVLKGLAVRDTSDELYKLASYFEEKGLAVDYFHSPNNNQLIEGIRLIQSKIAIVSNEIVVKLGEQFSEQRVVVIHFNKAISKSKLELYSERLKQLQEERDYHVQLAYEAFAEAKPFHERKEEIYLSEMSFAKADEVTANLIKSIFRKKKEQEGGNTETIFFGAATPKGAVHFIDELTEHLKKRFIIKGRSGCGKSTLMKRVANEALQQGMNVTYFICGFDPSSYDMVIVEELDLAIVDGTAPHIIDPTRVGDVVIDMFELCVNPQVEIDNKEEIEHCETEYKKRMKTGTLHLKKAAEAQEVIDAYINEATDKEKRKQMEQQMMTTIINTIKASQKEWA
ncbi:hypothetical protein [Alkalihalobacillus sp. LMS39]|uniref:hypothetical protein n=1 Tax=Alkalihalobacillus sp. LMS39 TaxID=2924032 RepID=UPI001FB2D9F6|nr:hypothetical protein [Alkalihalobacillus sp. LMS39]UOE92633.1 hypothetical protein MM271_15480 [Alkalihalobacillus sp. LMS39]